jgi:hypothetical protein
MDLATDLARPLFKKADPCTPSQIGWTRISVGLSGYGPVKERWGATYACASSTRFPVLCLPLAVHLELWFSHLQICRDESFAFKIIQCGSSFLECTGVALCGADRKMQCRVSLVKQHGVTEDAGLRIRKPQQGACCVRAQALAWVSVAGQTSLCSPRTHGRITIH